MQSYQFTPELRSSLHNKLGSFQPRCIKNSDLRDAAVAIVLTEDKQTRQASVLLTLRPLKLNRHSGQYALPGGRLDEGETDEQGALRELHEEMGLELGPEHILGRLDDFPTRSGFRVAPIVMWASGDMILKPDPSEVEEVYRIPLAELDSPDVPRLDDSISKERPVLSAFFPTLGHYLYAPTAAILYQFREVALRKKTTRVAHFDQPAFAWK